MWAFQSPRTTSLTVFLGEMETTLEMISMRSLSHKRDSPPQEMNPRIGLYTFLSDDAILLRTCFGFLEIMVLRANSPLRQS